MGPFIKNFSEITHRESDVVGSKGKHCALLAQAGFPVPSGFCITAHAYREFINHSGLVHEINAVLRRADLSERGSLVQCSSRLRQLFLENDIPADITTCVLDEYRRLAEDTYQTPYVAVRSSATAEDSPSLSFAGQYDTFLNVSGEADLSYCIKQCWASLFSERAMAYCFKNHIDPASVSMGVVIQQMVFPTVAGVLFTAHPTTFDQDEIIINANWGLGESVVSGRVSPDEYSIDKKNLTITRRTIADKRVMTVCQDGKVGNSAVPLEKREQQCLSDEQLYRLCKICTRIEACFDSPQDIEWGYVKDQLYILQSRPITTLHQGGPPLPSILWGHPMIRELFKDKVVLWSNWNVGEMMPYPLTPLSWSYLSDIIFPALHEKFFCMSRHSPLYPYNSLIDLINGRPYWNMNLLYAHPFYGVIFKFFLHKIDSKAGSLFTPLYRKGELQLPHFPKKISMICYFIFQSARILGGFIITPWFLSPEKLKRQCHTYWQQASDFEKLECRERSNRELLDYVEGFTAYSVKLWASSFLAMAHGILGYEILKCSTRNWNDVSADKLIAGIPGNKTTESALALFKLSQVPDHVRHIFLDCDLREIPFALRKSSEGKKFLKRLAQFMDSYGHRGVKEFDISHPRWKEDPTFVFQMIKNYLQLERGDTTPLDHFKKMREEMHSHARRIQGRLSPLKRWFFTAMLKKTHQYMPYRENPKHYVLKCYAGSRRLFLEIGRRLCKRGYFEKDTDIFFLRFSELKTLILTNDPDTRAVRDLVSARAQLFDRNLSIDPPFIVRSDGRVLSERAEDPGDGSLLRGVSASSGKASGRARVILDPNKRCCFNKGEILVAPFTDPGWTPLFLTAGALVMEVGGVISHGAVAAREYGIPAVVGVRNATRIIKTGDEIIVDGNRGLIYKA
ncbi:MAG: PEP/pyruvate-binding domain-containing protein [bacterium]